MDINKVLKEYDNMVLNHREKEAEGFLTESLTQAVGEGDTGAVLSLLNELVGFYREVNRYDEAILFSDKALAIMESVGLSGTKEYATTLINRANAQRAAGLLDDAIAAYHEVEAIYDRVLKPGAFDFAGLYNNLSLVYMEQEDYEKAIARLEKALEIVEAHREGNTFELAVTHANLGNSILHGRGDEKAAKVHLNESVAIFEGRHIFDTHYAAAVTGLGECEKAAGNLDGAAEYFDKALSAIYQNFGCTDYFYRVKEFRDEIENLRTSDRSKDIYDHGVDTGSFDDDQSLEGYDAKRNFSLDTGNAWYGSDGYTTAGSGLRLCRAYFEERVRPALEKEYPDILKKAAFGLFGYGSDCYGFDDVYSRDHDWGPGVCIWLRRSDHEKYSEELKKWYETLDKSFRGYERRNTPQGEGRIGVLCFEDFVEGIVGKIQGVQLLEIYENERCVSFDTGTLKATETVTASSGKGFGEGSNIQKEVDLQRISDAVWRSCSQISLGCLVNGEIFHDESGYVTGFREFVRAGYPDELWRAFIAQSCALFSQNLQYNVRRLVLRKDAISLEMVLSDGFKEAFKLCHYADRRFVPHDKWLMASAVEGSFDDGIKAGKAESGHGKNDTLVKDELSVMIEKIRNSALELLNTDPLEKDFAGYDATVNELACYLAGKIYDAGFIEGTAPAKGDKVYLEDLAGMLL